MAYDGATRATAIPGSHMPAIPTSTTVLDSILFRDAFGTPRMRAVFSDRALIGRYIEVEIARAPAMVDRAIRATPRTGSQPAWTSPRDRPKPPANRAVSPHACRTYL
jgi:hypothetical protein